MKALLFSALFSSGISFAQTNIIAAKSHSADNAQSSRETDNFGLPNETRIVKSVKYLKDDCIVEKCEVTMWETEIVHDTICDHPFLKKGQIDVERIKSMYPEDTKFIGFNALKDDQKAVKKRLRKEKRKNKKSSGLIVLLIGGGLFLLYLFSPNLKKAKA